MVATYGVTAELVRNDWFPHLDPFSANSVPSAATVARFINEEAAKLHGELLKETISSAVVEAATTSEAYLMCGMQLKRMVARRICMIATGRVPDLSKQLDAEMKEWREKLDDEGSTFLGNTALASAATDPDGPTHHIGKFGLDTATATADASDITPPFRKNDDL